MTFTFSYIPVVLFKIQITFLKLKFIFKKKKKLVKL